MLHTFTISGKVHLVWIGNQWRAQHKEECWKWHCFQRRLNKLRRHQKGCTLEEKKTKKENPMQVLVIADETIWTPATINIIQHKHQTTQSLHNDCDSRYRQLPHNYCDSRYRKHSLRTTVTVDTENTPSQRLWQSIQTTLPHNTVTVDTDNTPSRLLQFGKPTKRGINPFTTQECKLFLLWKNKSVWTSWNMLQLLLFTLSGPKEVKFGWK